MCYRNEGHRELWFVSWLENLWGNQDILTAVIPSWNTDKVIRFPSDLLGDLNQHLPNRLRKKGIMN